MSQKIEQLFCHLFGMPDETNINKTRFKKFCMENKPNPHQLLPTKDELTQHLYFQVIKPMKGKEL